MIHKVYFIKHQLLINLCKTSDDQSLFTGDYKVISITFAPIIK